MLELARERVIQQSDLLLAASREDVGEHEGLTVSLDVDARRVVVPVSVASPSVGVHDGESRFLRTRGPTMQDRRPALVAVSSLGGTESLFLIVAVDADDHDDLTVRSLVLPLTRLRQDAGWDGVAGDRLVSRSVPEGKVSEGSQGSSRQGSEGDGIRQGHREERESEAQG